MNDRKSLLKYSVVIEIIYILTSILFYLTTKNIKPSELIFAVSGIIPVILIINLIRKDISYVSSRRVLLTILGLWLLLGCVMPGILCFIFLHVTKEGKMRKLPIIENDIKRFDKLKAIIIFIIFIIINNVFPYIKFFSKISPIIYYIIIFIILILSYFKEIKNNFIIFVKNIKAYFPFVIKRYFIMLLVMIVVALPILFLNGGNTSTNQSMLNEMIKEAPVITILLSVLYAPLVEEVIFRLSFSKLFKNKYVYIIISGFVFGLLHQIDKFVSFYDLLYVLQYMSLGICLAKAYKDSNNIFVSISMHFIQNLIASLLVFFTLR